VSRSCIRAVLREWSLCRIFFSSPDSLESSFKKNAILFCSDIGGVATRKHANSPRLIFGNPLLSDTDSAYFENCSPRMVNNMKPASKALSWPLAVKMRVSPAIWAF
jgi:hypothetical protein